MKTYNLVLLSFFLLLILLLSTCQKDYPTIKKERTKDIQFVFEPRVNTDTFLFDQNYLIQNHEARIVSLAFTLGAQGIYLKNWAQFDENSSSIGSLVKLKVREKDLEDFHLQLFGSTETCIEVDNNDNYGPTTECSHPPFGSIILKGKVDLDGDGLLETDFDFQINTHSLQLKKEVNIDPNFLLVRFRLDMDILFNDVDFSMIDQATEQEKIAYNLLDALIEI